MDVIGDAGATAATVSGADAVYIYTAPTGYVAATSLAPGQGAWAYSANGGTATIPSDVTVRAIEPPCALLTRPPQALLSFGVA